MTSFKNIKTLGLSLLIASSAHSTRLSEQLHLTESEMAMFEDLFVPGDFKEIHTCVDSAYQWNSWKPGDGWVLKVSSQDKCTYYATSGAVDGVSDVIQTFNPGWDKHTKICLCLKWETEYVITKQALLKVLQAHNESLKNFHNAVDAIPNVLSSDPVFIKSVADAIQKNVDKR